MTPIEFTDEIREKEKDVIAVPERRRPGGGMVGFMLRHSMASSEGVANTILIFMSVIFFALSAMIIIAANKNVVSSPSEVPNQNNANAGHQ